MAAVVTLATGFVIAVFLVIASPLTNLILTITIPIWLKTDGSSLFGPLLAELLLLLVGEVQGAVESRLKFHSNQSLARFVR